MTIHSIPGQALSMQGPIGTSIRRNRPHFFAKRALTVTATFFMASSTLAAAITPDAKIYANKEWTTHVMHEIKPYFLSAYQEGHQADKAVREINGVTYAVERFNHGLAHGLRQGALAKDIVRLLVAMKEKGAVFNDVNADDLIDWAHEKGNSKEADTFIRKLELAAAFQRSGRQSEVSSSSNVELYKKYELQDAANFKAAAQKTALFSSESEIQVFAEAILWSNRGTLDEKENRDLRYLKRVLHAAHTFDLRRMTFFDGKRIQRDAIDQLYGNAANAATTKKSKKIAQILWKRSGQYLKATGDRDLVTNRPLKDRFFLQTQNPDKLVHTVHTASRKTLPHPKFKPKKDGHP